MSTYLILTGILNYVRLCFRNTAVSHTLNTILFKLFIFLDISVFTIKATFQIIQYTLLEHSISISQVFLKIAYLVSMTHFLFIPSHSTHLLLLYFVFPNKLFTITLQLSGHNPGNNT